MGVYESNSHQRNALFRRYFVSKLLILLGGFMVQTDSKLVSNPIVFSNLLTTRESGTPKKSPSV